MKKMLFALAASAAVLIAGGAGAQEKTKACWIYVGPIGDFVGGLLGGGRR